MQRYGTENEYFIHKIVGKIRSNTYKDVPLKTFEEPRRHDKKDSDENDMFGWLEDVLLVIQCGIDETKVIRVALKDVEILDDRSCNELNHEISKRNELINRISNNLSGKALEDLKNAMEELDITLD